MNRPSHKELSQKIAQAIAAIENGNIRILNMLSFMADADELGYVIDTDLNELLVELLNKSSLDNYEGSRPPQKAYQQKIIGAELFAFSVLETSLTRPVYYKFSIVEEVLYIVSLHLDRK